MSKGRFTSDRVTASFRIERDTAKALELLVQDPVSSRAKYGVKSEIVNQLLQDLIHARKNNQTSINIEAILSYLA